MMEKEKKGAAGAMLPRIRLPLVVEGRYDKSAILSMFSGTVITTSGFGIFNSKEKQALIRKTAKDGIIILTDSDAGGKQIRSFLSGILPKDKIYQIYIPKIEGKERRKTHSGKEGILGVEGIGADVLKPLLLPFCEGAEDAMLRPGITKADIYELGLTGADNSSAKRDALCKRLGLPDGMNSKALLEALNILIDLESLKGIVNDIGSDQINPKIN